MIRSNPIFKYYGVPVTIILIGSFLRVWGYWDWSLTNDELSAIHRLKFDSLKELINNGIWVDGHPALVQVFLFYWVKLFGNSALAIRTPFVLFSIGALIYFWRLSQLWLNKTATYFSLSIFATSQLFILYGQIARPYVTGLFFILAFSYHWLKILKQTYVKSDIIFFLLFGSLCTFTHYFAGLSLFFLLTVGALFCKKDFILKYIGLSITIGILFLPHIPITLNHLSIGGVGWLSAPTSDFIVDFVSYLFNNSILFLTLALITPALAILLKTAKLPKSDQWILLPLFILPYLTAYYYSIYKSPVLQYSVLIFCSPFLILFLASFIKEKFDVKPTLIITSFTIGVGVFSLVVQQNFYSKKKFANFATVAEKSIEWTKEIGRDNVLRIANVNDFAYLDYYLSKKDSSFDFHITRFDSSRLVVDARDIITTTTASHVLIAFANVPVPSEVHEFVKDHFPIIEKQERFFNSEVILYRKGSQTRPTGFDTSPEDSVNWTINQSAIQDSIFYSAPHSYFLSSDDEYFLTYKDSVGSLWPKEQKYVCISSRLKSEDYKNVILTISIHRGEEAIYWRGFDTRFFYKDKSWSAFKAVVELPEEAKSSDLVKIFFWNPDHVELFIDDHEITNFEDSDYNYYDF